MSAARPDYLVRLAELVHGARLSDLSPSALVRAHWVLADCIPVMAAGMQVPEMKAWSAAHLAGAAPGNSWVIGTGRCASARDAALVNGTAGTWLELDEGNLYAKGHPGIQVVPAALAVAQALGSSGAELLIAQALGYEVSSRISRAANVLLTVHPHGTWGTLGAAVAVARLKGFGVDRIVELLNVSATMGMATSRNTLLEGSTVRNIYTGHAGYMGILATDLVQAGFKGERDGVATIYGRVLSDRFDPALAVKDLGRDWIVGDGYYKLHPTGRYVHSAIDALENLLAGVPGGRLDPAAIESIGVKAYSLAAMLNGREITTSFGARFSIPFALASILVHGRSGLASFDDAAVARSDVQALTRKVEVVEEPAYTAQYPDRQLILLSIRLRDGRVLEGRCERTKGEPSNPHKESELEGKFFELGRAVWGEAVTGDLFKAMMRVEDIPDVRAFSARFCL